MHQYTSARTHCTKMQIHACNVRCTQQLLLKRVEDVLGPAWEHHTDGRQLKSMCDALLINLDTNRVYAQWLEGWRSELKLRAAATATTALRDHVLLVTADPHATAASSGTSSAAAGKLVLTVNLDPKTVSLFKEVRHLQWLGLHTPESSLRVLTKVKELADTSAARYPAAVALQSALRTYSLARSCVTAVMEPLLVPQLKAVRQTVGRAFGKRARLSWDSSDLSAWVGTLSEQVCAVLLQLQITVTITIGLARYSPVVGDPMMTLTV
jgi:dynein heavy chain 1, cytosolic